MYKYSVRHDSLSFVIAADLKICLLLIAQTDTSSKTNHKHDF